MSRGRPEAMLTMKKYLLLAILSVLWFGGTAGAVDLWQQLKKVLQPKDDKAKDSVLEPAMRALTGFSAEEEVAIGRQAAGNLLGAAPLVNDLKLQQYVNQVGRWVASQSDRPNLNWHFGVIDSLDINAFAAPGGYILVTKGLYRMLRDESELAGVLAHEIGHVMKQHHLKLLQQQQLLEAGSKILKDTLGDNEYAQKLIGTGAELFARALDKRAEFEADRIAVVLAARAGYDPFGLPVVLQDIGQVAKDDGTVALLFKTHPPPQERLEELDKAVGRRFDGLKGATLARRFYRLGS